MEWIYNTTIGFIATNLDELFCLVLFFSQVDHKTRLNIDCIIGQLLVIVVIKQFMIQGYHDFKV